MKTMVGVVALVCGSFLFGESLMAQDAVGATRDWRRSHERELVESYMEMLTTPNITRDLPNLRRSADWLLNEMAKRDLHPRLLSVADAAPVVYGELLSPTATHPGRSGTYAPNEPSSCSMMTTYSI